MLRTLTIVLALAGAAMAADCPAFFFEADGEGSQCENTCEAVHRTLFSYGACSDKIEGLGDCSYTCRYSFRVWTIVFIFVIMAAAVVILIMMLPLCITSCASCVMQKKDKKRRKHQAPANGEIEVSTSKQAAVPYNPYAYWPQYYTAGRM